MEPRHDSWWTPEVREVLTSRGAALCWADVRARPVTPLWRTADWGYVRFHEGRATPWPHYGRRSLSTWLDRITSAWDPGHDVYAYFNNDQNAAAVKDAQLFARLAKRAPQGARGTARQATTHPRTRPDRSQNGAHPP